MPRFRPHPCLFALALLAALGALPGHAAGPSARGGPAALSRNLIVNGGFEQRLVGHEWMPAAWDTFESGLQTAFYGRDTVLAHGGRYAVSVANVSNTVPMFHNWSQVIPVEKAHWNRDAVLTIWTRSLGVQGRAYVLVQAYRDTIQKMALEWGVPRDTAVARMGYSPTSQPVVVNAWRRVYFSDNETEWVKREVRVFVPRGTHVLVVRAGIFGTGQLMVDDASMVSADPAPVRPAAAWKNLLADPGFEGDGDDWEYSMPPYEGLELVQDTSLAYAGRACLRAAGGKVGPVTVRAGVCQMFDARPFWGKRLRLTAYVRTEDLRGGGYLKMYGSTPEGELVSPASVQISGDNDWTLSTFEMDVPPETYVLSAWLMLNVPTQGRLFFDDASLTVIGPAEYLSGKSPRPAVTPLARPGG